MTNIVSLLGAKKLWKAALFPTSDVSYILGVLLTKLVTSSMLHSSFLSPLLVVTSQGDHIPMYMTSKGYAYFIMLIRTKADWSALFSSHKYVHYKAHYYLLWSIPGHHNLSATRQKLFYTPMLPYIKDECHYNSTTLFIITDTILVLS